MDSDIDTLSIDVLSLHTKTIFEAARLRKSNCSSHFILKYYPKNYSEKEIQEFNLCKKIPEKLNNNDEDIAMWLLENNSLLRSKVCEYFSDGFHQHDESVNKVLKRLCLIICSLEVANDFVEGLKFFIPVIGCWDDDGIAEIDLSVLRHLLSYYVSTHLTISNTPLFDHSSSEDSTFQHLAVVVDIAIAILNLMSSHQTDISQESFLMSDFCNSLRTIMSGSSLGSSQSLSLKTTTSLFVSATSGRPMTSLNKHKQSPSYLFASPSLLTAKVSLPQKKLSPIFTARLQHDAIYLIDDSDPTNPCGCIPLVASQAVCADSPFTLELFGEKKIPLLISDGGSKQDVSVSHWDVLLLYFDSNVETIHLQWMDAINQIRCEQ